MQILSLLLIGVAAVVNAAPTDGVGHAHPILRAPALSIPYSNITTLGKDALAKRQIPALITGAIFRTCFGVEWQAALVTLTSRLRPPLPETDLIDLVSNVFIDWLFTESSHEELFLESVARGITTVASGSQVSWRVDYFWSDNPASADAQLASVMQSVVEQAVQALIVHTSNEISFDLIDVLSNTLMARMTFATMNTVGHAGE